jgi:hypothetical protein
MCEYESITSIIFEALQKRDDGYIYEMCDLDKRDCKKLLDWEYMHISSTHVSWRKDKKFYHTSAIYRKRELFINIAEAVNNLENM